MDTNSGDAWDFVSSAPDFYVSMSILSDLTSFIQAAHEFLPFAASQQSIRIKAIINRAKAENDHEIAGECEYDLEEIERQKNEAWPQIIWGSVLVSIYAAFEHGIEQAFRNWKAVFSTTPTFSQKKGQDFIAAAEDYSLKQINIPLFPDQAHRDTIKALKALRISYVHSGSKIPSLPKHIQVQILDGKYPGCSIIGEGDDARWIANAHTCLYFISRTRTIIRLLGDKGFHAYDLRLNKPV